MDFGIILLLSFVCLFYYVVFYQNIECSTPIVIITPSQSSAITEKSEKTNGIYSEEQLYATEMVKNENKYGNPMPYGGGHEVRSLFPVIEPIEDNFIERLYRGTGQTDEGLFFNRIPDPTLSARHPYTTEDYRPMINSSVSDLAVGRGL